MGSLKYYPQLDALRAFAVIGVLVQHFYLYNSPLLSGVYGVRLFFVLSGFLITSIILTHREAMVDGGTSPGRVARNFFIRRSLRLFPPFYLSLCILIVASLATGSNIGFILDDWPFHFLYLTNVVIFVRDSWIGPLSHYWTLAVEEQFYLAWFWVVLLGKRSWLPGIVFGMFLLGPIYSAIVFAAGTNQLAELLLPGCFDFLALGSFLGLMVHPAYQDILVRTRSFWINKSTLVGWIALAAGILAAWIDATTNPNEAVYRILWGPLTAFVFTWVVYCCYKGVGGPIGAILNNRVLMYLGKISYGIYIYHAMAPALFEPMAGSLKTVLSHAPILEPYFQEISLLTLTAITIAIASTSWYLIEKPIIGLKKRFSEGIGSIT